MKDKILENVKVIILAALVAIIFRSFIAEPYSIPSGSMMPNFVKGDYLFVSKYKYGISKHSFPFSLAPIEGRVLAYSKPQRGDVIVFRGPGQQNTHYIKRCIGLPGDKVQLLNGIVYINGVSVKQEFIENFPDTRYGGEFEKYKETLPNGVSYFILHKKGDLENDTTQEYVVPEHSYFFLGDNRDNSRDSRFLDGEIGYVNEEFLVGKAEWIIFSCDARLYEIWKWLFNFDLHRFFVKVNP